MDKKSLDPAQYKPGSLRETPLDAISSELSAAACDVLAERRRQVEGEGWTPEHDDQHQYGQLAMAAAAYAVEHQQIDLQVGWRNKWRHAGWAGLSGLIWPWDLSWWKPTTRRRDMVKAAALLIAEIERIDRLPVAHIAAEHGEKA